ncbi:MAG: hypothetical protein ACR2GY_01530 [Phycisphaerales bacterium]
MTPEQTLEHAQQTLAAHTRGELQFDEHLRPLKFVRCSDGMLVAPVMVAMIHATETVLFVPHADDDAMQLLITLDPFEEQGENGSRCDRWHIYHGEPDDVRWALLRIDAARFQGSIIDGQALEQTNPLAGIEAELCNRINQSDQLRSQLAACIHAQHDIAIEEPTLVGVDPRGLDVRGPFDVVRVGFDASVRASDNAAIEDITHRLTSGDC